MLVILKMVFCRHWALEALLCNEQQPNEAWETLDFFIIDEGGCNMRNKRRNKTSPHVA